MRKEEERLRAQNRREAQQRRNRLRPMMRSGLSANFLEEKDEDSGHYASIVLFIECISILKGIWAFLKTKIF